MDTILQKKQEREMEFPFVGGKRKVLLKEILFIESKSHQLWFERTGENLYMYGQINDLELILSNYDFDKDASKLFSESCTYRENK